MSTTVDTTTEIRPFRAEFPDESFEDLRRRIAATRWPEQETVEDASQGVQLATMQALALFSSLRTASADPPARHDRRPHV